MENSYFQSHECEGFRAKITVEWSGPFEVPAWRDRAADIAEQAMIGSAPLMRNIVKAMRGQKAYLP